MLGASGNVGRVIVRNLLKKKEVEMVLVVGRREIKDFPQEIQTDERLVQQVVRMDHLKEDCAPILQGVDISFITMGIGAPSKSTPEDLERVDCTLPTEFSETSHESGVSHVVILTSVGAQYKGEQANVGKSTYAGSSLYRHLKGKVEKNLSQIGFDSVSIFRPATLIGNTNTPGLFNWLAPKFDFVVPTRYNSIHIDQLGEAMVKEGLRKVEEKEQSGAQIYEGESLFSVVTPLDK